MKKISKSPAKATPLLSEVVSTFIVLNLMAKFIAKDKFIINVDNDAEVKIGDIGQEFRTWFLAKSEKPYLPNIKAVYGRSLNNQSGDRAIIAELGGLKKARVTLAEIYVMLLAQPNGEDGAMLSNGYDNIFYVLDINNILRTVSICWMTNGWWIESNTIDYPLDHMYFARVFSRTL
jgi:hypothetical protein